MSVSLILLLVLAVLILLTLAIGWILPSAVHVERSISIRAEPETVFKHLGDFEMFVIWSPWSGKDPAMKTTFSGDQFSVGHRYEWKGNRKVGVGSMEISHIEANRKLNIDLNFGPRGNSLTSFELITEETGTKVIWSFDMDMGSNPTSKLMGSMMDNFIGRDFSLGLNNLKNTIEK